MVAHANPRARIALVGSSIGEARSVMVEGESGIMACSRDDFRPQFEASLRRLTWPNGAQAFLYSAGEPESLRGPQHSHGCRTEAQREFFVNEAHARADMLLHPAVLGRPMRRL